ncbi:unnamed protein product [Phytophthora lilii]|uniref:Unnamed protein product n=1 Tax=Phytophthora lilii TaxID=2077276 RepID=A0A9W6U117_9STRA|nr:unnamed protein product [Phytophthora lilii]
MSSYKKVSISVSRAKAEKLAQLKAVNLTASELAGSEDTIHVHPANYEKIMKAKRSGKGVRLQLAPGEIIHDLNEMEGGSFWSWIKDKAYPWLKKNWNIIKPVASAVADVAVPAVATAFGAPTAGVAARQGLKALTGVGMAKKGGRLVKGSAEAKAHMAAIRLKRKGGSMKAGSFRLY